MTNDILLLSKSTLSTNFLNIGESGANTLLLVDINKLKPELKDRILSECLKKPTFDANGVYKQTKVNKLLSREEVDQILEQ